MGTRPVSSVIITSVTSFHYIWAHACGYAYVRARVHVCVCVYISS